MSLRIHCLALTCFVISGAATLIAAPQVADKPSDELEVVHVGPGVKAPVVTHKVDPEYSPEARSAHVQGTAVFQIIVDERGRPTNISLLSPLGFGLDELAQAAIERWTFVPGSKNGKPVRVWATIEVSFRMTERFDAKAERWRTQFNVAIHDLSGHDTGRAEHAVQTIQDLSKQKFPPAMYVLGGLLTSGQFLQRDPVQGLALIEKAAEKNYGPALYEMGVMYYEGTQKPHDSEKGLKLMRDAAVLGSAEAQFRLGTYYEAGDGVPREPDRARRYFRLCAASGAARCQFRLAKLLLELPDGKERDRVQAIAWALLAAEQGLAEARQLADAERPKLSTEEVTRAMKLKTQLVHKPY